MAEAGSDLSLFSDLFAEASSVPVATAGAADIVMETTAAPAAGDDDPDAGIPEPADTLSLAARIALVIFVAVLAVNLAK